MVAWAFLLNQEALA